MTSAVSEEQVAVVEGPRGTAEILEIWDSGRLVEYKVRVNGTLETYANIGEAYIAAGEKAGTPT
jgi:hypothetical protein